MLLGDLLLVIMYSFAMVFIVIDKYCFNKKFKRKLHNRFGVEGSFWKIIFPIVLVISILAAVLNYKGIEL